MIAEPLVVTVEGFAVVSKFADEHNIPIGGGPFFKGDYQSVFEFIPEIPLQDRLAANMADKIFKPGSLNEDQVYRFTGISGTPVIGSYVSPGEPDFAVVTEQSVYEAYQSLIRMGFDDKYKKQIFKKYQCQLN